MISYAPIPNWKELTSFYFGRLLTDIELADPWRKQEEKAYWFSRSAWALESISLYLKRINDKKNPTVWLPDYFCNGSLWPLRSTNVKLVFYPIGLDLEPKWDVCRRLAEAEAPDLFMIVHYFGAPANSRAARSFCNDHNAMLVEDAAHAIGPSAGIGDYGDFILYSPYKILPVSDGGLLIAKNGCDVDLMGQIHNEICTTAPSAGPWLIRKLAQKIFPKLAISIARRRSRKDFDDDPPYTPLSRQAKLSLPARRMLRICCQPMCQIKNQRSKNARIIGQSLKLSHQSKVLTTGEDVASTPYRFALKFDERAMARKCYDKLISAGIHAESWPDLPPEIFKDPVLHQDAIELRQSVVFMPVHQSIKTSEISDIFSAISLF